MVPQNPRKGNGGGKKGGKNRLEQMKNWHDLDTPRGDGGGGASGRFRAGGKKAKSTFSNGGESISNSLMTNNGGGGGMKSFGGHGSFSDSGGYNSASNGRPDRERMKLQRKQERMQERLANKAKKGGGGKNSNRW